MGYILLNHTPEVLFQSFYENITIGNSTTRVRFELRYLDAPGKWYLSMFDGQTGEPYCTYVPVISCKDVPNDLFSPFGYKNIGHVYCVPAVDDISSENPGEKNLGEFALVWSDVDAQ